MDFRWVHLTSLLDAGGHVTLGRMEPIECAAIAANGREVFAVLRRRPDESAASLMERLEAALESRAHGGELVNEVGSPVVVAARPSVRRHRRG
jgi:hypothetical protein